MEWVGTSGQVRTPGKKREAVSKAVISVVALCTAMLTLIGLWNTAPLYPHSAPEPGVVDVFTIVTSGIVFMDPETSDIVWRGEQRVSRIIGKEPWRSPVPAGLEARIAWRENRDIVGNPDHNIVSWVESVDRQRGDLVVVEADTGVVLARATLSTPGNRAVVIASVDEAAVYFATPDPESAEAEIRSVDLWEWQWSAGEEPRNTTDDAGRRFFVNDVAAGVWVVYGPGVMSFGSEHTRSFSSASHPMGLTDFGGALSPNGRYWYGAGSPRIFDTATGEYMQISDARERDYGWTGAAELTMTRPFVVCSARTGRCLKPAPIPQQGVCWPYGVVCGEYLPIY
jgi:hypothetical protein